ncbi:hypothetical protein SteCoe_3141 [Stentor coeruleus]|uniref:Uncharacterized protein n=1 Tax=Stentor coeruleus TaxID=5963 RepID=A0A1R2CXT3_9CILI|nr:hypothetical protein SteCoe_3141 [Stentor coeruleus]
MGNMIPDLCMCKERDGKDISKRQVKSILADSKIRVLDYVGIISSALILEDARPVFDKFIIYEISCIKDTGIECEHSYVKIKCFSNDQYLGIYVKVIFLSIGRFMIHVLPIGDEDEKGVLEFNFKKTPDMTDKQGRNLGDFIEWLEKNKDFPEKALTENEENMGKVVYAVVKGFMDEVSN